MEKKIMYSFLHDLFDGMYDEKRISVHLNTADNVMETDCSFELANCQISGDKQQIDLYGEDDIHVSIRPQDYLKASKEDEYYFFNTDTMNMAVTFV